MTENVPTIVVQIMGRPEGKMPQVINVFLKVMLKQKRQGFFTGKSLKTEQTGQKTLNNNHSQGCREIPIKMSRRSVKLAQIKSLTNTLGHMGNEMHINWL